MAQKKTSRLNGVKASRRRSKQGKNHRRPTKIYNFDEADSRLYDIFRNHDFGDFPHDKRHQLVRFYRLLMKQQEQENFTRLLRFHEIGLKHFIDCLMVPRLTEIRFPLLDVGTGPGFPGIPLKIMFPDERVVLGEGVRRRVQFLKKVRDQLELKYLDIIGRNIDETFEVPMQTVITRAVGGVTPTLQAVRNCLQPGGRMIFMKGPNVDAEIPKNPEKWGYRFLEDKSYALPNSPHKRRLVIFEREGS